MKYDLASLEAIGARIGPTTADGLAKMRADAGAAKPAPKRNSKYNAQPVYVTPEGNYVTGEHAGPKKKAFDSHSEFERWGELSAMQRAGLISDLRRQVRFDLHAQGGAKICSYVADFVYMENGRRVVEDRKGYRTSEYRRKKKWMLAEWGIAILET